jgi:integrase
MGRQLNRLSAKEVISKKTPGLFCDGGGLYLQVTASGSKTWIFRYRSPVTQKLRDMGLGPIHSVHLPEARERAAAQRTALQRGLDPIQERDDEIQRKALEFSKSQTFRQCATAYIDSHKTGWRNQKHTEQWTCSLETYAGPVIGAVPVQEVDTRLILQILEPIWSTKPETASRLRGRIENVLDWAKARGHRTAENPARWKGHLNQLLPALAKKSRVIHHKAMHFSDVGAFIARLRDMACVSARCLEFTILTAARTNEAIKARRDEFDLVNHTWTVPASRMKAKKEHRVPLSARAVEIVREMLKSDREWVFPSSQAGKPISNMAMLSVMRGMNLDATVHGFRSSFRDWAAERTGFPHEVCEMALAHTIPNAAEAAYRRGDLFEKRRKLMNAWTEFVSTSREDGAVIPMRQAA